MVAGARYWSIMIAAMNFMVATSAAPLSRPQAGRDDDVYVGDWRGQSICVVRESACHDEDSLYHVNKIAGQPGHFSMKLDKIVDGKTVTMGTMECVAQADEHGISCQIEKGVMQFAVSGGSRMDGTMKLTDGTLWRKISLRKM